MRHDVMQISLALGICMICLVVWGSETKHRRPEAFTKHYQEAMSGKGKGGKFTGSNVCRMCHSLRKTGAQVKIWQSSPHSRAYRALLSEEGKRRGAAKKIAKPEEDKNCLRCHAPISTVPKEFVDTKYKKTEGVGCEACHGPGEKHVELRKQAIKGKTEVSEAPTILLNVRDPSNKRALCARCHREDEGNESGEFDHLEAWKKIAHTKPKEWNINEAHAKNRSFRHRNGGDRDP